MKKIKNKIILIVSMVILSILMLQNFSYAGYDVSYFTLLTRLKTRGMNITENEIIGRYYTFNQAGVSKINDNEHVWTVNGKEYAKIDTWTANLPGNASGNDFEYIINNNIPNVWCAYHDSGSSGGGHFYPYTYIRIENSINGTVYVMRDYNTYMQNLTATNRDQYKRSWMSINKPTYRSYGPNDATIYARMAKLAYSAYNSNSNNQNLTNISGYLREGIKKASNADLSKVFGETKGSVTIWNNTANYGTFATQLQNVKKAKGNTQGEIIYAIKNQGTVQYNSGKTYVGPYKINAVLNSSFAELSAKSGNLSSKKIAYSVGGASSAMKNLDVNKDFYIVFDGECDITNITLTYEYEAYDAIFIGLAGDTQQTRLMCYGEKKTAKATLKLTSARPSKAELVLEKVDASGKRLEGAKFTIETTINYTDGNSYSKSENVEIGLKNWTLESKVGNKAVKNVVIKVTETKAPSPYTKIDPITITIAYNSSNSTWSYELSGAGEANGKVTRKGNKFTLKVKNTIEDIIDGYVWIDGQDGIKTATPPDGKFDTENEKRVSGVVVNLIKDVEKDGEKDVEIVKTTTTNNSGYYKFTGIEKGKTYYVEIVYDGIRYKSEATKDSAETEQNRTTFNNTIKTIGYNQYWNQNSETNKDYSLAYKTESGKATLYTTKTDQEKDSYPEEQIVKDEKTKDERTILAMRGLPKYPMTSKATIKTSTDSTEQKTYRKNFGLVEKAVDLSLATDLYEAEVSINGQTTKYTYDKIYNAENININTGDTVTADQVTYNLNLYASDYNYRIGDYTKGNYTKDVRENEIPKEYGESGKELEVYATYKIILNNQSTKTATINKVIDYYDSNLEFISATYNNKALKVNIDEKNKQTILNKEYNYLEISGLDTLTDGGYAVIYLKFKVNTDSVLGENTAGTVANFAEIQEYTTEEGGLVDCDSNPGNIKDATKLSDLEDDSDKAGIFKINLTNNERTISGYTFEDAKTSGDENYKTGDGIYNKDKEQLVNDVIVQLIELKQFKTPSGVYTLEYIWQETTSGPGMVNVNEKIKNANGETAKTIKELKKMNSNGSDIEVSYILDAKDGEYKFEGFIPGDYIIRFIYGDGTTVDKYYQEIYKYIVGENTNQAEYKKYANTTYNGQDYKSTIDPNYDKEWYNNVTYTANSSVARDSEARRLEVMAYSVDVNYDIGNAIATKSEEMLKNTWMCADTSKIKIAVDSSDGKEITNTTTVNGEEKYNNFTNINFGLQKRPETKITLEKHITGLTITANDGTTIVDAKVDIEKILDGKLSESIEGIKEGLQAIASKNANEGCWKLETNVEEVIQGAKLDVIYTMVVKNDSDVDYISKELEDLYEKETISKYKEHLEKLSKSVRMNTIAGNHTIGTYIGSTYYTGKIDKNLSIVKSKVLSVRDFVNNELEFNTAENEDFIKNGNESKKSYYVRLADNSKSAITVNNVLNSNKDIKMLEPGEYDTMTLRLRKSALSSALSSEAGLVFKNYLAEITEYTNAVGRKDEEAIPGNLYKDTIIDEGEKDNSSIDLRRGIYTFAIAGLEPSIIERDEALPEEIGITKPTGEDKQTNVVLVTSILAGITIIAVGTFAIKKYLVKR